MNMKPMKKNEYRAAIEALDLSQLAAGDFLEIGERTSRRYALGESPIPGSVAILLRHMVRHKLTPDEVKPEE